jgi:hypothetical protein
MQKKAAHDALLKPPGKESSMGLSYVISLLAAAVVILLAIPFLAWKGRPRGFTRLNWLGVAVGAVVFALVLLVAAETINSELRNAARQTVPTYERLGVSYNTPGDTVPVEDTYGKIWDVPKEGLAQDLARGDKVVDITSPYRAKQWDQTWVRISADEWPKLVSENNTQVADDERAERRAELWPPITRFVAGLFGAAAIGALLAVFFYQAPA